VYLCIQYVSEQNKNPGYQRIEPFAFPLNSRARSLPSRTPRAPLTCNPLHHTARAHTLRALPFPPSFDHVHDM